MGFLLSIDDLDGQTCCVLCSKYIDIDYSNKFYNQICNECDSKLEFEESILNKYK